MNASKARETGRKNIVSTVSSRKQTSNAPIGKQHNLLQSAPASVGNLSSSNGPATKTAEDLQVEADIVYSQYLHAVFFQKMMAEKNAEIEKALKEQLSVIQESGLENPNVSQINKSTEKLKQLREEYSRLKKLKEEVEAIEKACHED